MEPVAHTEGIMPPDQAAPRPIVRNKGEGTRSRQIERPMQGANGATPSNETAVAQFARNRAGMSGRH